MYRVFCAQCNQFLLNSKSIKKRGQYYLTFDENFIHDKITCSSCELREYKTEKQVGKMLCKVKTCGSTLGVKIEYSTKAGNLVENGYTLNIKSIKFKNASSNDNDDFILFKKWKDINFKVDEIPI